MARKKKPNDPTITQRDRRYREGRKAAGFVPVRVFVPVADAHKIRDLAARLRLAAALDAKPWGKS